MTKDLIRAFVLLVLLFLGDLFFHFSDIPSLKIYDAISSLKERIVRPPKAIDDIVLVGIDSETIEHMKEKWPYSRATFAKAIHNLKKARPRAIGLDFNFFGESTKEEDALLRNEIVNDNKVVLGALLTKTGGVQLSTMADLKNMHVHGIVNKFQDSDGTTRGALTYLINTNPNIPRFQVFSWELRLLDRAGYIDLGSLEDRGDRLVIQKGSDPKRGQTPFTIPVDPITKTFLIHFQAHSKDFKRLSFWQVANGGFDSKLIENKIVLVGFLSEMFQDLHHTPIGWLPGLTLNANVLLTLYTQNFIRSVPKIFDLALLILGVLLSTLWVLKASFKKSLPWLLLETAAFFGLSFLLLLGGFLWNYTLLPVGIILIPVAVERLRKF